MLFHQLYFHSYRIPIPNSQQNFINNIVFTPEEALHVIMEEVHVNIIFQKSCKFPTINMLPSEQEPRHMTHGQLV